MTTLPATTDLSATPVRPAAVTAVVCLALAAVTAAMSSLNVALPDIARSTHATQTQLSWIIDAYSLTFAVLLLPGGALGDRYGRRRVLLVGLTVFAGGSIAAAAASDATALIGLRAVIGIGAALVMPATLSTITSTFPAEHRATAVSVWAGVAGGAAILGVVLSGALLEAFSWQSVFGVNIVLAAIAILGTVLVVPESADPHAPRLDVRGALLSVVGLVAIVCSVIEAPTAGWGSTRTLTGLALGLITLVAFVLVELRIRTPMLDPRVFASRGLSTGALAITVQFFVFYGLVFLILQYLQLARRDSALTAALSMLPMAATLMPASRLAPKFADRVGAGPVCAVGLVGIAAGSAMLSQLDPGSSSWHVVAGLALLGAGMGTAMTPATSAVTAALPASQQGVASALNDLSREVGGALGIAVLGSLATAVYRNQLQLTNVPAAIAEQARESYALAAHLHGPVAAHADTAFTDGFRLALLAAAATAAVAAVVVGAFASRD